jgi:hypothetical protein
MIGHSRDSWFGLGSVPLATTRAPTSVTNHNAVDNTSNFIFNSVDSRLLLSPPLPANGLCSLVLRGPREHSAVNTQSHAEGVDETVPVRIVSAPSSLDVSTADASSKKRSHDERAENSSVSSRFDQRFASFLQEKKRRKEGNHLSPLHQACEEHHSRSEPTSSKLLQDRTQADFLVWCEANKTLQNNEYSSIPRQGSAQFSLDTNLEATPTISRVSASTSSASFQSSACPSHVRNPASSSRSPLESGPPSAALRSLCQKPALSYRGANPSCVRATGATTSKRVSFELSKTRVYPFSSSLDEHLSPVHNASWLSAEESYTVKAQALRTVRWYLEQQTAKNAIASYDSTGCSTMACPLRTHTPEEAGRHSPPSKSGPASSTHPSAITEGYGQANVNSFDRYSNEVDHLVDTYIRGLEVHVDPAASLQKLSHYRGYIQIVFQQQQLHKDQMIASSQAERQLKRSSSVVSLDIEGEEMDPSLNIAGGAVQTPNKRSSVDCGCDELAHLCAIMSSPNVEEALRTGFRDAHEAVQVYLEH